MVAVLLRLLAVLASALIPTESIAAPTSGNTLRVGPQHELKSPSAAAKIARDGDTIEIEAGTYAGDVAVWRQHNLTIRSVGRRVHLRADGAHAEGKGIWVIKGANTTIEGIEFSGAQVPHRNGAGIRLEGIGLTLRHCYFHHNEMGILTGDHPTSNVLIEQSEFAYNMRPDGHNHNIYIGMIQAFILRESKVHHATTGHNVKTRAAQNFIVRNRILDERDGRSSYALEFPNGGYAYVVENVIQQGPRNDNRTIVSFGAEGLKHATNRLHFLRNTVVNDDPKGGLFLFVKTGGEPARITGNIFAGRGELLAGPGELTNNAQVSLWDFRDPAKFDYRLKSGHAARNLGALSSAVPTNQVR